MAEQTNGVDAKSIVPMVERSIIIRKQLVIFQKKCLKQIVSFVDYFDFFFIWFDVTFCWNFAVILCLFPWKIV